MNIAVTDANIFIDLYELALLPLLFELNLTIHTTKEVMLECDSAQRDQLSIFIQQKKLHIHTLTDGEVKDLQSLSFSRKLSFSDQTILWLAYQQKSRVLTGDKLIRKWCDKNDLEVHGILWLLDQFTQSELLTITVAIDKLELLMSVNAWLPLELCEKMIEHWKNKV
ncbi:MAG: hypothetical protein AAF960_14925 [Bacteroidota bacterium]